jgi:hypothetical protein
MVEAVQFDSPYSISLSFDTLPKSLNKKLRSHYHRLNRESKAWDLMVEAQTFGKKPHSPLDKATLTITRHSYRMLDFDGLVGSMKPVVDALVSAGIIKDDSWGVIGPWNITQEFRPKAKGPLINILVEARQ